jgi:hypothetical protein
MRTIAAMVGQLFDEPDLADNIPLNASLGIMAAVIAICLVVMFAWYQRRD